MSGSRAIRPLSRRLASLVWAVVALDIVSIAAIVFGIIPEPPGSPAGAAYVLLVLTTAFGVVGARIVSALPRNPVGWLLWIQASLIAVSGFGQGWAVLSVGEHGGTLPGTAVLAWVGGFALVEFLSITGLVLPLVYPEGRLPSRRWRAAMGIALMAVVLVAVGSGQAFLPGPMTGFPTVDNPFGIPGSEQLTSLAAPIGAGLVFIGLPLSIAAQVTRFRRGRPIERQQIKWFAAGLAVPAALLASSLVLQTADVLWALTVFSLGVLPVAIGLAILRYRLYDIDRLISRTIGWLIVTSALVAVFAVVVIALQAALSPVTANNTLAVAGSTLAAASLFQPLRTRVQRGVDRRFNRSRVDADRAVAVFAGAARDEVDLAALRARVVGAASAAVAPASAAVWLRDVH